MPEFPDIFASIGRLGAVIDELDDRAPLVLAYHAAIERELGFAIGHKVPKPELLSKLPYIHKVCVWSALQTASDARVQAMTNSLLRFNALRNAIAHGDKKSEVDACLENLIRSIPKPDTREPDIAYIAAQIIGRLNDVGFWS